MNNNAITVEALVNVPVAKAWELWTNAEDIQQWNNASPDWHTPSASNDLTENGRFVYTMAAKDGSFSFDFGGRYDEVRQHERIAYTIDDGRKVAVNFQPEGNATRVVEVFEPEGTNPIDMQRAGWQAIIDNFKKYAETKGA